MPEVGPTDGVKDHVYALAGKATNFIHEVLMLVINWDTAKLGNGRRAVRRTSTVHLQLGEAPKLQKCRADPACRAVNQRALARSDVSRTMQHLVRRDVLQHEAHSLPGVQPGWHRNQFTLRQADELRVSTVDRQRGNDLAWFDSRGTVTEPLHHANQIPSRREGNRGRFGMNALARHYVGQGDTRGQNSHARLTIFRLRALFFNHPKRIGPAVVSNDDAPVPHRPLPRLPVIELVWPNGWRVSGERQRVRCSRGLGGTRYRPGTWFTDLTGDMVDSFAQDGGEGVEDALERNDEDAGADAVRAGCGRGAVHDDGAVRAIRDQPDDGAQVAQAVSGGWSRSFGGSMSGAAALPASDRSGDCGSPGSGATPAPLLGCPQIDPVAGQATARPEASRRQHRRRHAQTSGPGQGSPPPPPPPSSRPAHHRGFLPQPTLVGRLQGSVQDPQRPLLLPPDRGRQLQPVSARLPVSTLYGDHPDEEELRARLPHLRPARGHPHRQWHPFLRRHGDQPPLQAFGLVDPPGHPPRADPALSPRAERPP